MSVWVLVISYWLHMLATVTSIGGLFFQAIVIPISISTGNLEISQQASLLEAIRKRFEPLAWLSLFILIGTGLVQMSANPQYDGVLSINSQWASALLAKHIAIVLMVLVAAMQTWVIQPRINRLMLRIAQSKADSMDIEPLLRRQKVLTQVNFVFALVVLVFTAIARSS
jgi:uncharacterized membrane protein